MRQNERKPERRETRGLEGEGWRNMRERERERERKREREIQTDRKLNKQIDAEDEIDR